MDSPSTSIRDIARHLLAVEASMPSLNGEHEAERVCEKLRASLSRFAGPDGFVSLMRRALAISRAEVPSLENLTLKPDGCFEGFEAALGEDGTEAGAALTANLLWLLETFIGKGLAIRMIRDEWPDVDLSKM